MTPTKKIIIAIVSCIVLSNAAVLFLFILSGQLKDQHNSFLRQFPPHAALEGHVLDLKYNSYYVAGATKHHVYLANYTGPLRLLVADENLTDTQKVILNIKGIMDQKLSSPKVKVDSPYFYVTDGVVPRIYRGRVSGWRAERYSHDSTYFLDIVPVNPDTYLIKSLGNPVKENLLGKISTQSPHLTLRKDILKKQVDGVFCTAGMMHYDRKTMRLVYLYYYRNQYIVMDTSLHVVSRGNTIDTVSRAQVAISTIASEGTQTFSAPPVLVNKRSAVSGDRLYVYSNLLAKNEPADAASNGAVIDVYAISSGRYQFSFYIYNYAGKKMTQFSVYGSKLYAQFGEYFQVWDLLPQYFERDLTQLK